MAPRETYIVYDGNGRMADGIIDHMRQLGYLNVFSLRYGFEDWRRNRYPVDSGSGGVGLPPTPTPRVVSSAQAYQNFYNRNGYTWIDLRSSQEIWANGKIPKSINVQYITARDFAARLQRSGLTTRGNYIIYNSNGAQLTGVINQMAQLGYHSVYALRNGFEDWRRNRYPVERGSEGGSAPPGPTARVISPRDAYSNYYDRRGYTWIDLRSPKDIQSSGKIPKSVNLHYTTAPNFATRLQRSGFSKQGSYIVYDANGALANNIIRQMEQLGYRNVFSIKNGFNDWRRNRYPVERDSNRLPGQTTRPSTPKGRN